MLQSVSVKALAFRVLQEMAARGTSPKVCPTWNTPVGQDAEEQTSTPSVTVPRFGQPDARPARSQQGSSPAPAIAKPQVGRREMAPCGDPACAGCYDVGDGKKIHPPKCGQGYLDWLKKWEAKGRVQ